MDADDWNARYSAAELVWSRGPNEFLVGEVGGLAPGTALDVACGEGRNAIWLAERGWTVTAFDFSSVAIGKAKEIAAARGLDVDWRILDVDGWEPDAVYDLVSVLYLQLPQPQRSAMFAKAARSVAPGGTLLFTAHALRNLQDGFGGPQDPAVLPEPAGVAADLLAADAGLEIDKAEEIERLVDTPGGPRTAIDMLVRAHGKLGQE